MALDYSNNNYFFTFDLGDMFPVLMSSLKLIMTSDLQLVTVIRNSETCLLVPAWPKVKNVHLCWMR